jgi:nicotinamidase-related amidase
MSATALLVIDVQRAIVEGAYRETEVLAAIADLAARARAAAVPVIYLQHCHDCYHPMMKGAEGWAIHSAVAPKPGDVVIEKTASDSFYRTTLQAELERRGVRRLVICGLQTEFCVDATARAALSHGYDVALAADAHTTGDAILPADTTIRHHNHALGNLAHPSRRIEVKPSAEISFIAI